MLSFMGACHQPHQRSQKRIGMQAEDLSRKGAHIGELEEEIAYLAKESEVMMFKIAHQAEGRAVTHMPPDSTSHPFQLQS